MAKHVFSESVAISRYLIARYGNRSTVAAQESLEMRAREDEWVCYFYGELDETSLYVMRRHEALSQIYGEAPEAVASARTYASRHLSLIAIHLQNRNFVVGDRFGLADIILVSCLDWGRALRLRPAGFAAAVQRINHTTPSVPEGLCHQLRQYREE